VIIRDDGDSSFLFPFAIVEQLSWVTMPVNLVVCLGFTLISETGRVLEDPFTHFTTRCR
jgi:predicted membrane chloride channel (bestrophin family)